MSERPANGGRVLLELTGKTERSVHYEVTLDMPDASWRSAAEIGITDGAVVIVAPEGAPSWLVDAARAFLRSVWNGRRGPDAAAWPRRVLRWRAAPVD